MLVGVNALCRVSDYCTPHTYLTVLTMFPPSNEPPPSYNNSIQPPPQYRNSRDLTSNDRCFSRKLQISLQHHIHLEGPRYRAEKGHGS